MGRPRRPRNAARVPVAIPRPTTMLRTVLVVNLTDPDGSGPRGVVLGWSGFTRAIQGFLKIPKTLHSRPSRRHPLPRGRQSTPHPPKPVRIVQCIPLGTSDDLRAHLSVGRTIFWWLFGARISRKYKIFLKIPKTLHSWCSRRHP